MPATAPKKLSVVIPAYNVGAFIGDCIASVTKQRDAATRVHAIVVVDGATDDTLAQAQKAAAGHEAFVQVVEQKNGGLSAARNTGIELATTDYITFLDGDDVWLDGYLDTLLPLLDSEPDLIEYNARRMTEAGKPLFRWRIASNMTSEVTEVTPDDFIETYRNYSWARIFRTSLVRAHLFPVKRRYEDSATTPWYYWNSAKRLSVNVELIGYRERETSIMKTPVAADVLDIAITTREAAAMYRATRAEYWQRMTHRSYQQACGRVSYQPFREWPRLLQASKDAIGDVPPPPGFMRRFNLEHPLFYTRVLYAKNIAADAFLAVAPRWLVTLVFPER